jgi:hypothetical protein
MSTTTQLYVIQSPEGDFIHTTISDSRESSIEEFLLLETTKLYIVNSSRQIRGLPQLRLNGFAPFEDEGYKCAPVEIVSAKSCAQKLAPFLDECPQTKEALESVYVGGSESGFENLTMFAAGKTAAYKYTITSEEVDIESVRAQNHEG